MNTLLSREAFKHAVFERAHGRCVFCGQPAVDAHHILERKLWPDGGYYLANGAAVCEAHHLDCETTRLSVEAVRQAAGIAVIWLPPGFLSEVIYDKWGNRQRSDGTWAAGPLFEDVGARRALAQGGRLGEIWPD